MQGGVSASRVVVGADQPSRVIDFLVLRFPMVRDWPARLAGGKVLDSSGQPLAADAPCRQGMLLWYWRAPIHEPRVAGELVVLHQDAHLVVVDKPHFLPVTPAGRHLRETVLVRLRQHTGIATLAPMHRLDMDTAGVVVFTVQPAARDAYHALLRTHQVHKAYEAVAPWRGDLAWPHTVRSRLAQRQGAAFMQMQTVPGEPNAETRIVLINRLDVPGWPPGALAHYRLTPVTGQRHQLRAQLQALGLPIVGDRIYPDLLPALPPGALPDGPPLQLLARELVFTDPITGLQRQFTSQRQLLLAPPAEPGAPWRIPNS